MLSLKSRLWERLQQPPPPQQTQDLQPAYGKDKKIKRNKKESELFWIKRDLGNMPIKCNA